jgi:hypothetical protein
MSKTTMVGSDVYVRHTDKDGTSFVQHHRAWDVDRFLKLLAKAALEAGGKAEAITEEQFRRVKWKKKR